MTDKEKSKLALALSRGKDWKQVAIEEREKGDEVDKEKITNKDK